MRWSLPPLPNPLLSYASDSLKGPLLVWKSFFFFKLHNIQHNGLATMGPTPMLQGSMDICKAIPLNIKKIYTHTPLIHDQELEKHLGDLSSVAVI